MNKSQDKKEKMAPSTVEAEHLSMSAIDIQNVNTEQIASEKSSPLNGQYNNVNHSNSNNNINNNDNNNIIIDQSAESEIIRATRRRYFILIMYGICSMEKSFQWINLSTITNKVALYYGVDNMAVNWTSVLFMITFIPLVLPTGWLIERIGLRKAVLIGSTGIALGAIIKCFAGYSFSIIILGQIIVSLSEQFIFCIPARIASVWFPDHQVSLATGFGIFGNQCGIALGFLVPQALLKGMETREEIGVGLDRLFLWTAIIASVTWIILVFLFDDEPKHAPGAARLRKRREELEERNKRLSFVQEMRLFGVVLKDLMKDINCDLLIVAYGINVGTGYAIQTLLNQMITSGPNWDDQDENEIIGNSGMIVIASGMVGALSWGHLCDLTHKYILINRVLYLGAVISVFVFGLILKLGHAVALYFAAGIMGFMLIGYTVAGLDTIVELTYPAPELVSTSVMNLSPQIFGTLITFACSAIVDIYDSDAATGFLVCCLVVGLVFTLSIKEHLRRQNAVCEEKVRHDNLVTMVPTLDSVNELKQYKQSQQQQ